MNATAYLLYDTGQYDVWMGNARGTRPSQGHTYLNATGAQSKNYWSFSLHEIAIYDCAAFIDYILHHTNQTQLHYVAFSQGTTLFFILTSALPSYNSKIRSMVAMAPAVQMTHSQHTFLNILSKYYALIKKVLDYYKIYSIDYGNRALRWLAEFACKKIGTKSPFPCQLVLFFLDSNQINCVSRRVSVVAFSEHINLYSFILFVSTCCGMCGEHILLQFVLIIEFYLFFSLPLSIMCGVNTTCWAGNRQVYRESFIRYRIVLRCCNYFISLN